METLQGERSVSAVGGGSSWFTTKHKVACITAGTAVVIGFVFWRDPGGKKPEEPVKPPTTGMSQHVTYEPPPALPNVLPVAASAALPLAPRDTPAIVSDAKPLRETVREAGTPAPAAKPVITRMYRFASSEPGRAGNAGGEPADTANTSVTYKPSTITGAKAGAAMDGSLTLFPGIIHCILDTAIDSTLPGPLLCHLDQPVISDGGVVLMARGTRVIGSYSNEIHQGQARLLSVSATAYTPEHVPVPLGGGPMADSLGRSGLDGDVDNHYLSRFGGAVLLSLADSAIGIVQAGASKGGNSYVSFNSGSGVGTLAQQVLQSTINQPPTITKPQGSEVSIWIMTPIDFSAAYKLNMRKN
jgi:type IV secretion system protein VirB10